MAGGSDVRGQRPTSSRVGYLIKRAQQALRAAMDAALADAGLTTAQYAALAALEETPGISGATLARRCFVTPQTMNGIVANLEAGGLVERTPHPEHGRILELSLTREGRGALRRAHGAVATVERRLTAQLTAREQAALGRTLQRCIESLEGDRMGTGTGSAGVES